MTRRGSILRECVLALAIFVAAGMTILSISDGAASAQAKAIEQQHAEELARSALAQIESGLASIETLSGPIVDSQGRETPWRLEISSERSAFDGMNIVRVTAERDGGTSVTLHQLLPAGAREAAP